MNKLDNQINEVNKDSRQGIFFGVNSGILTTLGVIAGISQTTKNPMYVVVSVLSLAISDCVGEAYGMYLSKKAEKIDDKSNGPFLSLVSVFLAKFITVLIFLLPLLFSWDLKYYKNLSWPMLYSVVMLAIIDYRLAKLRNEKPTHYIINHLILLLIVAVSTKFIGVSLSKLEKN
jgi:vacuolar iron transporter family protein